MVLTTTRLAGMKTVSWINMLLGALVIATPFFTDSSTAGLWSAVLVGALILALAIYEEWAEVTDKENTVAAPSFVNGVAGLWLMAYPYAAAEPATYAAVTALAGLVVLALEIFNFSSALQARRGAGVA